MTTQSISHVLVSDLTGALLGHEDALEGFRQWFGQERWRMGLVYVTHRPTPHPRQLLEKFKLPTPDYLICALGIEIFDFALDDWMTPVQYENWNADQVRNILRALPGMVTGLEGSRSQR